MGDSQMHRGGGQVRFSLNILILPMLCLQSSLKELGAGLGYEVK